MPQQRFVFVLSIWLEQELQDRPVLLRGSVERVGAGRIGYFTSLETALDLLYASIHPGITQKQPAGEETDTSPAEKD